LPATAASKLHRESHCAQAHGRRPEETLGGCPETKKAAAIPSVERAARSKPLALKQPVAIAALLARPASFVGKTVQVTGKITAVCQEMGCWMYLADDQGRKIRIKVNDGEIVFPKDGAGRTATAEGVFTKLEMTREEATEAAREEAKDSKKPFDPASIKTVDYQIQGTGAVVE
jgi:hypothetical protein